MKTGGTGAIVDDRPTPILRRPFFWIITLVIAAFVAAPLIGDNVELRESLLLAAVYITLASNLNLMLGYAGYINFGSIVFFGLGGYICVWLVDAHHWPLAASLIAAGIGVGALAFVFGLGILRLRGPFFALSTIGIVEGVQAFVQNFEPWGGLAGENRSSASSTVGPVYQEIAAVRCATPSPCRAEMGMISLGVRPKPASCFTMVVSISR
jgi:ABC-type branched-subunit amino acid transport system permease subunit